MISICVLTYNGEKFVKQQLLSILQQLKDEDEVIISDDCSSDSTISIIKSLNPLEEVPSSNKCFVDEMTLVNAISYCLRPALSSYFLKSAIYLSSKCHK